jgi:hypothetical protein
MYFRQVPALTSGKKHGAKDLPERNEEGAEESLATKLLARRKERREAREKV